MGGHTQPGSRVNEGLSGPQGVHAVISTPVALLLLLSSPLAPGWRLPVTQ